MSRECCTNAIQLRAVWAGMIDRCHNSKSRVYHRYGGRGIFVCDEWRNDFFRFVDDVGLRPSGMRYSLDRIDNDGPYAPWNVRWASPMIQCMNRGGNSIGEEMLAAALTGKHIVPVGAAI